MDTFYLVCAGLGGTLILLQILAGTLGIGDGHDVDHDVGHDHDGHGIFGVLTVRAVCAALTFFGLGGLTAGYYAAEPPAAFGAAVLAGGLALYSVAALMRAMQGLKADGTARIERAVGLPGTVYLRIPAGKAAPGKVHVAVQNRTVEYLAVTAGAELPTGAPVRIVAVVSPDTVEVEAAA